MHAEEVQTLKAQLKKVENKCSTKERSGDLEKNPSKIKSPLWKARLKSRRTLMQL